MGVMWSAVVPVKAPDEAKSRLLPPDDPHRAELAMAFLEDVLAALAASRVARVAVVTASERVRRIAEAAGALVVAEPPPGSDPLNDAVAAGAAELGGDVLALAADLPCLDGAVVAAVLAAADRAGGPAFVPDAAGTGTAMLAMRPGTRPMFGPRSRARHASAGYAELDVPGRAGACARRDVDTAVDLWDAARLGTGPATTRVLAWRAAP